MVGRFTGAISLTNRSANQKYAAMALITVLAVATIYFVTGSVNLAMVVLGMIVGNTIEFILGKSIPAKTLSIFAIIVVGLLLLSISTTGATAMWSIIAIGLFNSIMFPTIFTLAIADLGKYTSQGSSLLVMAIVGGAIMTPLMGVLVETLGGYQQAFLLPIVCYLFIVYYGISGHKVKKKATA